MKKLLFVLALLPIIALIHPSDTVIFSQESDQYRNYYPDFTISIPSFYYMPSDSVKIKVQLQWVKKTADFKIKVYRIKDPELFYLEQQDRRGFNVVGKDSANLFSLLEEIDSYEQTLNYIKRKDDNEAFYFFDGELTYIPKNYGAYIVRIYFRNKVANCGFFVSRIGLLTKSYSGSVLNYTADRNTSEPIDSVKINMYLFGSKHGSGFTSGGVLNYYYNDDVLKIFKKANYTHPFIIAIKDSQVAVSDPQIYFAFEAKLFNAIIVTSQPVYRPPATAYFKTSIRKYIQGGYDVYANQYARVTVTDPKGVKIFRKSMLTDGAGSISDSIALDAESPLGNYMIKIDIIDTADAEETERFTYESFSQVFAVEEFKKPEYKVEIKADKEQYSGKDNMKLEVQSDYYFGSPVQNGDVEYKVYKSPMYRPWWYFSEYRWWYEDFYTSQPEYYSTGSKSLLFQGKGKLDEKGHFNFTYVLNEDFKISYTDYDGRTKFYETDFSYTVYVYVKDKSRHNVYAVKSVNVTRADYFLTSHTDKYLYKPGEKIGLIVHAADYSNKPAEALLNVTANRITYEGKYPDMKKITSFAGTYSGKTSPNGEETIFIDAPLEGYYEFEITSFDSKSRKVADGTSSRVSSGANMRWWYRDPGTVEIVPEKESYKPGDTCVALVILPYDDVHILVTSYNRIVVSHSVEKVSGNSAYIKFPVTEGHSPNFFIGVSFVYDGRVYENAKSIAVIPESKFISVGLSPDKEVYKPRDTGYVNISVKDRSGNPVKNAEVTIGLVDESIYAIKPENVKDIRSIFYSPAYITAVTSFSQAGYYWGGERSDFPSYFESYDYKNFKPEELTALSGKITNRRGWPLPNARVIIDKQFSAASTASDGSFKFYIPGGTHTISFYVGSYFIEGDIVYNAISGRSDSLVVYFEAGKIEFADLNGTGIEIISPEEEYSVVTGSLNGKVTDVSNGVTIQGAVISVEGTDFKTTSDVFGSFMFANIPVGLYRVKCTYVGYGAQVVTDVLITGKNYTYVEFRMQAGTIATDTISISNLGYRHLDYATVLSGTIEGIENISAKTSGIITNEQGQTINMRLGRKDETQVIIDGEKKEDYVEAVTRTDFRDAVIWVPSVKTDEQGNARVQVVYPDNLTTWRFTARVITDKTEVGQITHPVISRKDVIVRVIAPRFFQQKDEVTVSTIIHNYLNEDKQTKVTLKLDNVQLVNPVANEQIINLLKNEEKRIDWVVKVDKPIGMAKVFASALTNEESDAMEQKLVIHPYGLKIANYYTYKINTGSDSKTFEIPAGVDPRSASLKLRISPSIASSMLGSLDKLIGFPYGCIEQTISRFIPTVITYNVLKELGTDDPYLQEQIPLMIKKGFAKISSMQNKDGGWGWWKNDKSNPFMTAYVVYGLKLAANNGYEDKGNVYEKGLRCIKKLAARKKIDPPTKAFITYVLAFADSSESSLVLSNIDELQTTNLNVMSRSLLSMAAGIIGRKQRQADFIADILRETETDGNGSYWGSKSVRNWQDDNIHTTSFVLRALIANENSFRENRDIIESALGWILAQRRGDSWGNTQQTAFIIYMMADYLKLSKELEADYLLKVTVNGQSVLEKQITKESIFKPEMKVDIIGTLIKNGTNEIRIEKYGTGNAYISNELLYYADRNEKEIGETYDGFEVEREYFELSKAYDKKAKILYYKKKRFDGTVKSGEQLFVKVRVTPGSRNMSYFMLEEPIPAGCEIIREEWAYPIREEADYDGNVYDTWRWWFSDKEIRDNRIVYFASQLGTKTYEFTYLLMAEIPGTYNVMPSQGMLMYYPEVSGTSGNMVLKITD